MIVHVYVYENTETTLWFESLVICEGGPWQLIREYDKDIPDPVGPGGTTDYNQLTNKPLINSVTLSGNKTSKQLNIEANLPEGGTAGQVLTKKSDALNDAEWRTPTGGSAALTAELTTSKAVGGIPSGKTYGENTPMEDLFKDMLNPVENPVLTAPSATLTTTGGTLVEEAVPTSKVLTVNFNRGSINPAYGTSGYRSGDATGYTLNGGTQQTEKTFNVTVDENNKSFTARVDYAQGEQPKNSAGQNYSSPLPAGFVETSAIVFEVVAALWSNAANITTVAKEALISKSTKLKRFDFPAQTAANPEIFDVPASWNVTAVELLNTLNNQWVDCRSEFDITDTTHGTVAYKRYTYNGGDATGARSVRIKWS